MYLFDFWYCGRRSRVVTHVKFIGGVVSLLGFMCPWKTYIGAYQVLSLLADMFVNLRV